ncbi:hypothetical protein [Taibaiella soli]|uniref:hypothetical protein n=1 Tax=Taibaiella soli TaxID=1649169 RepID=UPI000F4F031A|nr:hypothetical protein [Taibaiella soli]
MENNPTSKFTFEINRNMLTEEHINSIHERLLKRLASQAHLTPDSEKDLAAPFSRSAFSRSSPDKI